MGVLASHRESENYANSNKLVGQSRSYKLVGVMAQREREREREIYARRPCIVLQRGIVGRVPWCKDYTES